MGLKRIKTNDINLKAIVKKQIVGFLALKIDNS